MDRLIAIALSGAAALLAPTFACAVQCAPVEYQGIHSTVCRVDLRQDRLKLFLKDSAGTPYNFFQRVEQSLAGVGQRLLFAMNAGMFREDYTPVGLLVLDGQQVHRLNLATGYGNFYLKPNGVFVLGASGAKIVETTEYRALTEPSTFATQSGPLLVHQGQVNSSLNPQGSSRLIRNGVGIVSANEVVFAISDDPVSFYEFASLFRDKLRCAEALYFDGNVSSLFAPALGRNDQHVPVGPIVAVTADKPSR